MDTHPDIGIVLCEWLIILFILVICAVSMAMDKALDLCNRTEIRQKEEEGDGRATRILRMMDKPSNFTTAARITLVALLFIGGMFFYRETTLRIMGREPMDMNYGVYILSVLGTAVVFCLIVAVFSIILPRQIATKGPEETALRFSGFGIFLSRLLRPFVVLDRGIASVFLTVAGKGGYEEEKLFSEDEVMNLLEVGQETGVLKEEGKKMIDSIFAFDDKLAYEIMTPRTDVFSIDIDDGPEEYLDDLMRMQYSRIPVYEEDSDNIVGILNIKDFLIKARESGFENVDIREILREPFFVPETKNIDSLFFELQRLKQHIAVLIDEYGGFSGIVTMEDIIEEVMGEIDDEFDEEEQDVREVAYHTYEVDGGMDLDDLNEETGSDLTSETSETIGGYLIDLLGEIPAEGETREIETARYTFVIEEVKDRRVEKVRMTIHDEAEEDSDNDKQGEKADD